MIDNTSAERVSAAADAVASFGDAFVIETREELLKVYGEYIKREHTSKYPEPDRHVVQVSEFLSKLSVEQLDYHLDALLFLLKRYRAR